MKRLHNLNRKIESFHLSFFSLLKKEKMAYAGSIDSPYHAFVISVKIL